jgi:hypothetical protein
LTTLNHPQKRIMSKYPALLTRALLFGGCFALAMGFVHAQTLLVDYGFNEGSGGTIANSGSLGSSANLAILYPNANGIISWADPSATVSGTGSALVSTGATRSAQPGYVYGDGTGLNTGLSAFTVTLWVNLSSVNGSAADRLVSFYGSDGTGDAGFQLQVNTSASTTPLTLFVDGSTTFSSASTDVLGEWVFLAVTYDGTSATDNVSFYSGAASVASATLGSERSLNKGSLGVLTSPTQALRVGNPSNTTADRSPAGMFDDVRIYAGALDATQIENVRLSAVPEPSACGLLAAGLGLLASGRRRRRR